MARKPVPRAVTESLPEYCCNECWHFEPIEVEHGACYGVPPTPCVDGEEGVMHPRPIVFPEDRGCHFWKPRHKVN